MWASYDVLEDTNWGIQYYSGSNYLNKDVGFKYLFSYGIMQLLVVQQDAIWHLSESLGHMINPHNYEEIEEIRKIRNITVGHPTKSDRGKTTQYCSINQNTININGFDYFIWTKNGHEIKTVNIKEKIKIQYSWISESLSEILYLLKEEWNKMREEYIKIKLQNYFQKDFDFRMEKLLTRDVIALGYGYKGIKETFDKIVLEFKRRYGDHELKGTSQLIREISFILDFFYDILNFKKEYCEIEYSLYGEMLTNKMEELKDGCRAIDEEIEKGLNINS